MSSKHPTTLSNHQSCLVRTHGENHFDFIHGRLTISSVADEDKLFNQAFKALKPGGWFERNEVETAVYSDDGTFPENSDYARWAENLLLAVQKMGRVWPKAADLQAGFEKAGFVNVQVEEFKRPSNDWPKDPRFKEIGRVRKSPLLITAMGSNTAVHLLEFHGGTWWLHHGTLHPCPRVVPGRG